MYLTRECDYGIRIIRALASGERKTVKEICDAEFIPKQFGYKILKKLEHAGILRSIRGRDGGYQLIKSPDTLAIYDVVVAIDESLFIIDCLREDNSCDFKKKDQICPVHMEFKRVQDVLMYELSRNTMADILKSY